MRKMLVIFCLLVSYLSCSEKEQIFINGIKYPFDFCRTGTKNYILDLGKERLIHVYNENQKVDEINLFLDYPDIKKILAINDSIFVLYRSTIGIIYDKKEQKKINLSFFAHNMALFGDDTIILLGLKKDKIFHVLDFEGNCVADFGEFPENIEPLVGPRDFWIKKDTIYVAGINQYRIYRYIDMKLIDYFEYPDSNFIREPIKDKFGDIYQIYHLSGINGVVDFNNKLYISTFKHEPIQARKAKSTFSIDIFDKTSKKLLQHITYDSMIVPVYADKNWLYLINGSSIIRWGD